MSSDQPRNFYLFKSSSNHTRCFRGCGAAAARLRRTRHSRAPWKILRLTSPTLIHAREPPVGHPGSTIAGASAKLSPNTGTMTILPRPKSQGGSNPGQ